MESFLTCLVFVVKPKQIEQPTENAMLCFGMDQGIKAEHIAKSKGNIKSIRLFMVVMIKQLLGKAKRNLQDILMKHLIMKMNVVQEKN